MKRAVETTEHSIREVVVGDDFPAALELLTEYALPVVEDISIETRRARKAMDTDPVDTLTLSNKLVELSILSQRLGERVALMGYIVRASKEWYERVREAHKVRLVTEGEERWIEVEEPKGTRSTSGTTTGKQKKFVTVAAGVADSMKVGLAHEEFKIYNECEMMMDKLVYARKSTDKTIDSIRSKLSYEKANERNA